MFRTICALLLLCSGALTSDVANRYIENVLFNSFQYELLNLGLEPANLPNFTNEFYDYPKFGSKVKVDANYTNGRLAGLFRVHRYSDCSGPKFNFGATTINCTIAINDMYVDYRANLKYGNFPPVSLVARADIITTTLVGVEVVSYPQNPVTSIKEFKVKQLGHVVPYFIGLEKPLNNSLNTLEQGFQSNVGVFLNNTLTQGFQYALGRAFARIPMPRV